MGLFQSLFGNATSDAAQKARQDALNAFNAIQTPELKDLQVKLNNEVVAGTLTPEAAESQLLSSNAFNEIATDPSLVGAQKQAIQQLQQIGTQGGLTAVDKAQLNDINNAQNQQNQSQNAATMQQMQQRGIGNSDLNAVNQLVNEQGSADRAANSGLNVAAQAQARALAALQGAGTQAGQLQGQEYSQAAQKAQAENAIDLFNKQTLNNTNLYNVDAANKAEASNLANAQNVGNANTGIQNTQAMTNAQAAQQLYNDQLQKAQGIAGVDQNAANAEQQQKTAQYGANVGLIGGLIQGGATAAGGAMGGPVGAAAASSATKPSSGTYDTGTGESDSPYSNLQFAEGGEVPVEHPDHPQHIAMGGNVKCYAYGGDVHHHPDCAMAEGGDVPDNVTTDEANQSFMQGMMDKPKPSMPVEWDENNRSWDLRDKLGNKVGSFAHYSDALDFADKVKSKAAQPANPPAKMAKGGKIGPVKKGALHKQMGIPQSAPIPAARLESATNSDNELLRKRAQFAENAKHWNHAEGGPVQDFRAGGPVPGTPIVPHNSYKNDVVPAKLSPGEVVVPLDAQKSDDDFEHFMNQFKPSKKEPKIAPNAPLDKLALNNLRKRGEENNVSVFDDVQAYLQQHPDFLKSALGGLPGGNSLADIGNNADALATDPTVQAMARGVTGAPITPKVPNPGNPVSGLSEGMIAPNLPQAPQTPPAVPTPSAPISTPPSANTPPINAPQSSVTPPPAALPTSNTPSTPPAPITIDPTEDQRRREASDAAREHARRMSGLAGAVGGIGDAIGLGAQAYGINAPKDVQGQILDRAKSDYAEKGTTFETKLKQDPQSDVSKSYRAMVAQIVPDMAKNPAFQNMSAQEIGDKLPMIDTMMKAQATKDTRELGMKQIQANKELTMEQNRKNREDTAVNQGIARVAGVRGDASLARAEMQRDAAATAVNRIDEVHAAGQQLTPFDYTDILGQLYKARSGQAPGEQIMKEIRQPTGTASFNKAWTYLTGQQAPGTTASIANSLREAAASMGKQADEFHDGYMKSHLIKPAGVSDEAWAPVAATTRGTSYADNVASHQATLKKNKPQPSNPGTSSANDPLGIR